MKGGSGRKRAKNREGAKQGGRNPSSKRLRITNYGESREICQQTCPELGASPAGALWVGSDWEGPSWLQPHHPSLDRTDLALSMGQTHPELPFGVWMKGEGAKPFPRALAGVQRLGGGPVGVARGRVPRGCHALVMATDPAALTAFLPAGRNNPGCNQSAEGQAGRLRCPPGTSGSP